MIFKKRFIGTTGDLVKSPEDNRDLLSSQIIPEIKRYPEVFPSPYDLTVLNQLQEPSCVGMALAGMKQHNEFRERVFRVFDGSWIYKECKKIDGLPNFNGTYLRSGLQVLKNVGAKPITSIENPSIYKIAQYASIRLITPENIKKHITIYGTVLAGFRGTNEGWRTDPIRPPRQGENIWGHAVFLTHFDKNYIYGQNSWGENAHNKGIFRIPLNYMPFEAWVITLDKENILKDPIKPAWIAQKFLDANNKVIASVLNVREGAGLNHKVIHQLKRGEQVTKYGGAGVFSNGLWWTRIILP